MRKCIIHSFLLVFSLAAAHICQAATFLCPTLKANELYAYFDWIDDNGNKIQAGEWNQNYWRLWVNGDSYLTPKDQLVQTIPMAAHYYQSTNTWYLKCISADFSIGPRNNVWTYDKCVINKAHTGFDCN